jgi:protein SCO1/2
MKSLANVLLLVLAIASPLPSAVAESGDSIYVLPVTLTDQGGKQLPLKVHRGYPVLVTMFYGSCPAACPLLISALQRMERRLPTTQREQLKILMISIDPVRDTSPALMKLAKTHRADLTRWSFVHVPPRDVRQIAAVLGVQYRQQPDGEFNHSSVITLLDRDGSILAQTSTIGRDDPVFMAALGKALAQ